MEGVDCGGTRKDRKSAKSGEDSLLQNGDREEKTPRGDFGQ